jgi:D-alanine-D-alanine ligase
MEVSRWTNRKIEEMIKLSSRKEYLAIGVTDFTMSHHPLHLPHYCRADLLITYLNRESANRAENEIRRILGKEGYKWSLELISERPPMKDRKKNQKVYEKLREVADMWEIPLDSQSSLWPSAAGLVPARIGVVCGIGPEAHDLYTPQESIKRISLLRMTLLLAQYLLNEGAKT